VPVAPRACSERTQARADDLFASLASIMSRCQMNFAVVGDDVET